MQKLSPQCWPSRAIKDDLFKAWSCQNVKPAARTSAPFISALLASLSLIFVWTLFQPKVPYVHWKVIQSDFIICVLPWCDRIGQLGIILGIWPLQNLECGPFWQLLREQQAAYLFCGILVIPIRYLSQKSMINAEVILCQQRKEFSTHYDRTKMVDVMAQRQTQISYDTHYLAHRLFRVVKNLLSCL